MTTREIRNQLLGARVIKGLESRNMKGYYVTTKEAALAKALELIEDGSSVSWGGTMTMEEIGLDAAIKEGPYNLIDRDTATDPEEKRALLLQAFGCDYYIGSTNAITEDGVLINIDGNANRVAAYAFGPRNLILIVGMNKVVKSEADALSRARNEAAPINAARFGLDTPCMKNGMCYDCKVPDTICCQILTTRYSKVKDRIKVILVDEVLGY
ncbi:MAG: lactate utilization protein [Hespellia sp.]|nr:lactate utilization protein [Hespellia sp.]